MLREVVTRSTFAMTPTPATPGAMNVCERSSERRRGVVVARRSADQTGARPVIFTFGNCAAIFIAESMLLLSSPNAFWN